MELAAKVTGIRLLQPVIEEEGGRASRHQAPPRLLLPFLLLLPLILPHDTLERQREISAAILTPSPCLLSRASLLLLHTRSLCSPSRTQEIASESERPKRALEGERERELLLLL